MAFGGRQAMLAVVLAVAVPAGCGDDGGRGGGSERADLPVSYHREYGGYTGGVGDLRVERDGRGTVDGGPPGAGCTPGKREFRLSIPELDRLRSLVATLPQVEPRTRVEEGVEGNPTIRIEAGGIVLRYVGLDVEPPELRPLLDDLDRLVTSHCRRPDRP